MVEGGRKAGMRKGGGPKIGVGGREELRVGGGRERAGAKKEDDRGRSKELWGGEEKLRAE